MRFTRRRRELRRLAPHVRQVRRDCGSALARNAHAHEAGRPLTTAPKTTVPAVGHEFFSNFL